MTWVSTGSKQRLNKASGVTGLLTMAARCQLALSWGVLRRSFSIFNALVKLDRKEMVLRRTKAMMLPEECVGGGR